MISGQPLLFPSDWHFPHNLSEVQGLLISWPKFLFIVLGLGRSKHDFSPGFKSV